MEEPIGIGGMAVVVPGVYARAPLLAATSEVFDAARMRPRAYQLPPESLAAKVFGAGVVCVATGRTGVIC